MGGDSYYHVGVASGILSKLWYDPLLSNIVTFQLQVNIDELPLFISSHSQFWPILGVLQSEIKPETNHNLFNFREYKAWGSQVIIGRLCRRNVID